MQGLAGPVALALVGLWVVYLVPQVLRHRQQLLDSRADDRYSDALRVVAVTRRPVRARTPVRAARRTAARNGRVDCGQSGRTTGLLTPGRGQAQVDRPRNEGGATVDRPQATASRRSAEASREIARTRAAFAAAVARRGAAARRRGVLAAMLAFVSVAGWAVVAWLPSASLVVGVVPTALLGLVVGLGRNAVVAGRRHDEQWRAQIAELEREGVRAGRPTLKHAPAATRPAAPRQDAAHPSAAATTEPRSAVGPRRPHANLVTTAIPLAGAAIVGRAVRPSQAPTDVFDVIVADRGENNGGARHASGATPVVAVESAPVAPDGPSEQVGAHDDGSWSPVPMPLPTYVLKPEAPRREPAPLPDDDLAGLAARSVEQPVEAEARTTGSIDLDAVLERRRASGQ